MRIAEDDTAIIPVDCPECSAPLELQLASAASDDPPIDMAHRRRE